MEPQRSTYFTDTFSSNDFGNIQPLPDFSTEDNELLMSVLCSTPLQEQYSSYNPNSLLMWEYVNPQRLGSFDNSIDPSQTGSSIQSNYSFPVDDYRGSPYIKDESTFENIYSPLIKQDPETISNFDQNFQNSGRDESPRDNRSEDSDNSSDNLQKNKRRESQNRASRNYRQRKKAYIKEIEEKLDQLRLENEQLRHENQKNRRVINQFRSIIEKPPLIRSYSAELQLEDEQIEKIIMKLNFLTSENVQEDDLELKELLKTFHEHVANRQKILQKDALQLINPKLQEKLVRLEGVPPRQIESKINEWLQEASQFVSQEQIVKLSELKTKHHEARAKIWNDRNVINISIKEFYQKKIASERMNWTGKLDSNSVQKLASKLEELKKNFIRETELNNQSATEFSTILTPYQEAIITIQHYSVYKERVSAFHMLNNVWNYLSNSDDKQ